MGTHSSVVGTHGLCARVDADDPRAVRRQFAREEADAAAKVQEGAVSVFLKLASVDDRDGASRGEKLRQRRGSAVDAAVEEARDSLSRGHRRAVGTDEAGKKRGPAATRLRRSWATACSGTEGARRMNSVGNENEAAQGASGRSKSESSEAMTARRFAARRLGRTTGKSSNSSSSDVDVDCAARAACRPGVILPPT